MTTTEQARTTTTTRQASRTATPPQRRRGPATRPGGAAAPAARRGTPRRTHAPRVPFVVLILGLLGGTLMSLLVLQAVLAEDAHIIAELQRENRDLSREQEALRQDVLHSQSPEVLAERAEELGMEPGEEPMFVDLDSGDVLGGADLTDGTR